jgi:membrane protein DedA with SNARE-associated domain
VTRLLHQLLSLHGVAVYLTIGLLVFAEDALFVGFVVPGETAAILGGTVGYLIGARYGTRLLSLRALGRRKQRIEAARATLARRGGLAVFLGRFVTLLHAVMPFLAGSSHMPYRRFLAYNAAGGLVWGIASVLLGYLAGDSYAAIQKTFGRAVAVVIAAPVAIGLVAWRIHRRRREHRQPDHSTGSDQASSQL